METINFIYYNTYDKPINYKGLRFYPATVKDYFDFYFTMSCLQLDQFNDRDIHENYSILQMPYLDYLFFCERRNPDEHILDCLIVLLGICLRLDFANPDNEFIINEDEQSHMTIQINDVVLNYEDFEWVKRIICEQNDIDMTIFELDPRVREQLVKTMEFQSRNNQNEMCSLEDQIVSIMINTSLSAEQVEELSLRKFKKILERVDHLLHYKIYKSASMSGFVTFKEEYPHWLAKLNKNNVSANVSSYDELKQKVETRVC